jgi:putative intracellular protease/amidase
MMNYHEVLPMSRAELEVSLNSGNVDAIYAALLSAAYFDKEWRWVQQQCLDFLDHHDNSVRWVAATCLGHLARIHGQLDVEMVLARLVPLKSDPEIGPAVEDALDDIRFFLRFQ